MGTSSAAKEAETHTAKPLEANRALLKAIEAKYAEEMVKFAHSVAHDLREPMRVVLSFTELLSRRYEDRFDEEGRELIGYITDASRRMERFVDDLLNYSRQLRGSDRPPTDVDTEAILKAVLMRYDKEITRAGAKITYGELPPVQSEFEALLEVFSQLISNSLLFRADQPPVIHISAAESGNEMMFMVRDNGVGIDPEYAEQIFQPFSRLHGRKYPGNGLGLAICKQIVERQGGRIWVEPGIVGGSEFRFTLPN
jgi:chemotaxis family two-component system sensor kinase Cph1